MNLGRVSRHYRHRRGANFAPNLCLRCFHFGHRRGPQCRNDPLVACGKCYRAYIFTTDCSCDNSPRQEMTLRMVSGANHPRPVIDVTIGIKTYEAFINMSVERTTISPEVVAHINKCNELINVPRVANAETIEFSVRRRYRQAVLQLKVCDLQTEPVILGMDYFMAIGFDLTIDRVTINQRSPVLTCPKTIDFIYNQPEGRDLRTWLQQNDRPLYTEYTKYEQPALQEEPRIVIENDQVQGEDRDADILELHADNELLSD